MTKTASDHSFELTVPGVGYAKWDGDSVTEYKIKTDQYSFEGKTTSRTPWSKSTSTPESWLVYLPLPLHWHVQSLASNCNFTFNVPGRDIPKSDQSGSAMVHQEKNWAASFPKAHMWLQARDGDQGLCCAGGQILGMEAFLLGYRGKKVNIDYRPPFAIRFLGLSPFLSYTSDWTNKSFTMSAQSFRQKITIEAQAPEGTFFSLSAPFPEGHKPNMLAQSFQASFKVKVYESGWFSAWQLVEEREFEDCSLEFGAGYYPPAGSDKKFH
jgi:tocopherol cyclase